MNDEQLIGFFSSLSLPFDSSEEEDAHIEKMGEEFRGYLWGHEQLRDKLGGVRYQDYGEDLRLILFQFHVFPDDERLSQLKEIEPYRAKEKSIGINCIVNNVNFFDKTELERKKFLRQTILAKLGLLNEVIKRRKLDTKLEKLIADVQKLLS